MACTLAESPSDPLHRKLRQLRCLPFRLLSVERTSSRAGVAPTEVQRLSRRTVSPTDKRYVVSGVVHPSRTGHGKLVRLGASPGARMSRKPRVQRPGREVADCVEVLKSGNVSETCRKYEIAPISITVGKTKWKPAPNPAPDDPNRCGLVRVYSWRGLWASVETDQVNVLNPGWRGKRSVRIDFRQPARSFLNSRYVSPAQMTTLWTA